MWANIFFQISYENVLVIFLYECVCLKAWHSHSKRVSKGFQYSTFITWVTYRFVKGICGMARGICGVIFPANSSQFFQFTMIDKVRSDIYPVCCGYLMIYVLLQSQWSLLLAWINLNPIMESNTSLIRIKMKLLINSQTCTNTYQIPNLHCCEVWEWIIISSHLSLGMW